MDKPLFTLDDRDLNTLKNKPHAAVALENGQIIHLPQYYFQAPAENFLSETILDGKHKNISYDPITHKLGGFNKALDQHNTKMSLQTFMHNYALFCKELVTTLLPLYAEQLQWGRTSYRPAEIKGRPSSKRKDDTRLHVDSFAASPVHGLRILRVFCNINPYGEARVWNTGEPFEKVLRYFSSSVRNYNPKIAKILQAMRVTKTRRSAYDHFQLQLHDRMKLNDAYQNTVCKSTVEFPALSSWIVFTDHVSHAALSGQFLLEQTFYLPVSSMQDPSLSPLRVWEKTLNRVLN